MTKASRTPPRFRVSIGLKLAAATVSILLLAASAVAWALVERERRELFERKERATERMGEQLGLALSAPLEFDDDLAVAEALHGVIDDPELVSLRVRDRDRDTITAKVGSEPPAQLGTGEDTATLWTDDALWIRRPIRDGVSEAQGEIVIGVSLAAERAVWTRQRDLILVACTVLSLVLTVLLVEAARRMVVRPLSRLAAAADAFGRGERVVLRNRGDDEVGRVANAFTSMMDAIGERERRIADAHTEVERLLDAMRQAVFSFGPELVVVGRSSRAAREIFRKDDLAGADVRTLLLAGLPDGSPESMAIGEFLDLIFNVPVSAWSQAIELAPRELCLHPDTEDERELALEFVPLCDTGELVRVMVVVTDETAARRMVRQMRSLEDRHAAELIATRRLLGLGANVFVEFAEATTSKLGHVEALLVTPSPTALDEAVRKLHAARGDARALGLAELARVLTGAEATVAEARDSVDPPPVERWTADVRARLATAHIELDGARDRLIAASPFGEDVLQHVTVSARDLDELGRLRSHGSSELSQCIDRIRSRTLGAVVVGLDDAVGAWAAGEGKRVEVEIVGATTRISPQSVGPLRTAIVQLARNAVAHGIESPDDRQASGKSVLGTLRIVATMPAPDLPAVIEVIDDGGGIDFAALALRATEREIVADIATLPFVEGLSTRRHADALAGRGAGLAAVREELASIGYDIAIDSTPGVGTRMRLAPVQRATVRLRAMR